MEITIVKKYRNTNFGRTSEKNTIENTLVNDQCFEEVPSFVCKQKYFLNHSSKSILVQWVTGYTKYMTAFPLQQSHGLYAAYITGYNLVNFLSAQPGICT